MKAEKKKKDDGVEVGNGGDGGGSGDGDDSGDGGDTPAPPRVVPECPICLEHMAPPRKIYQCVEGHVLCEICRPEILYNRCHICPYLAVAEEDDNDIELVTLD